MSSLLDAVLNWRALRASEFHFIQLYFFDGDIRDSRKYYTYRGKQAVLFINLLGKGLTQEFNGDGGSI